MEQRLNQDQQDQRDQPAPPDRQADRQRRHLVVLTGASRGLGHAIAAQLLQLPQPSLPPQPPQVQQQPAQPEQLDSPPSLLLLLCISRRSDATLTAHAQQQQQQGQAERLLQWTCDLADAAPVAARLAQWLDALDANDIASATLINNAGALAAARPLADADAADVVNALRVGLEAPLLLSAAFLRATGAWPAELPRKVLNISSGLGRNAMASQAPYCAAKAGLDHFSRAVALEEARRPNGARIVSLAPGVIDTDMQVQLRSADAAGFPDRARFVGLHAGGQLDTPDAAAAKVLRYLARADFGMHPVADVRDATAPSS